MLSPGALDRGSVVCLMYNPTISADFVNMNRANPCNCLHVSQSDEEAISVTN